MMGVPRFRAAHPLMQNARMPRPRRGDIGALISAAALVTLVACGDDPSAPSSAAPLSGQLVEPQPSATATATPIDAGAAPDVGVKPPPDKPDPPPPALDVSAIMALLSSCNEVSTGRFKKDSEDSTANVPICGLANAVYWQADMDIDCDGQESAECNKETDPWFQSATSGTDSNGDPLDSATLPFVVIPLKSTRFDYSKHGLKHGSVVMVIYKGKYEFGVFGDLGPSAIIGEASYAMAKKLGINPDPSVGGTSSGVTYIAFTGTTAVASKLEDHDAAVQIGETRARQLLLDN